MRIPGLGTLALLLGVAAVGCAPAAAAQPPEPRDQVPEPARSTQRDESIKEAQPSVLLLKRKDGSLLQEVLGFTLEDFERFLTQRALLGLGQQPPKFQIERLTAQGVAQATRADLTISLSIVTSDSGWTRVPLRLSEAVMRRPPRYDGPGAHRIEFDAQAGEYSLWLRGATDQPHGVTFEIAVPLIKAADQAELKLSFPRAAVSELTLTVPDADAVAKVSEGGVLDATSRADSTTQFKVLGLERAFAMSWRPEADARAEPTVPLEGSATIDARVDAERIRSDVTLTIRGFGSRLESFQLRIPAGASLLEEEQPEYSIEPAEGSTAGEAGGGRVFDVRLRERAVAPVVVRLSTEQTLAHAGNDRAVVISGVELLGAARQFGHVNVRVAADWQIVWDDLVQLRQIDEPAGDPESIAAAFEYSAQPFTLSGRLVPLASHLSVEPIYTVECDPQQLRLQARLKYRVRGAKAFFLDVGLGDWELDDVAPRTIFDVDRVAVQAGRPLRIPLLRPATGEFELVLRAHRDLPANATRIEFTLPQPVADNAQPAVLEVVPAPNTALAVRDAELVGLFRQRTLPAASTGTSLDRRLVFRGQGRELKFAAGQRIESRAASAEVHSQIHVDERGARVEQTMQFRSPQAPLEELILDVPAPLASAGAVEWTLNGDAVVAQADPADANTEHTERLRIRLGESRSDAPKLVLHYLLDVAPPAAGSAGNTLTVPLVMPTADVTDNEVAVFADAGIKVRTADASWQVVPTGDSSGAPRPLRLQSSRPTDSLVLTLDRNVAPERAPIVAERVWFQSRVGGGYRSDRAVCRLSGGGQRITLRLPPGALVAGIQATLDGQSLVPLPTAQLDLLTFELPATPSVHVLDVSYRLSMPANRRGDLALAALKFGPEVWVRQVRWQLLMPRNEHLLSWPADLTAMYRWQFHQGIWRREPLLDQSQLETWIGVPPSSNSVAQANCYLFDHGGPIESLEVRAIGRGALVLGGAGTVLSVGLLLLYFPVLRRSALLFGAAVVAGVVFLFYPESAPLLLQVAVLGAGLLILAVTLSRAVQPSRMAPLVVRSGSSSVLEPGSTRTHQRGQAASGSAPVPLIPQPAGPEEES